MAPSTTGLTSHTDLQLKVDKTFRDGFLQGKAEDAGGLTPVKDDNAVMGKSGPGIIQDSDFLYR